MMPPAAKEGLPAAVGELVACLRVEVFSEYATRDDMRDQRETVRLFDELQATLSALTAEAGKGITPDWVIGYFPADVDNETKVTIRDAFAEWAALSTATPAGEWDRIEAAAIHLYGHHTGNHPTIHCNRFPSWDELTQAQRIEWRKKAMLAASPRGAGAGEAE